MLATDERALLRFFQRIPAADRQYLREDVADPTVLRDWVRGLDYSRVLPLLAVHKRTVVGDASLHRHWSEARRHVAEVRVVIDPAWRNQGLGRTLLYHLVEIARAQDPALEKLMFEIVAGVEAPAERAARALGFKPVAIFASHVIRVDGQAHDVIVLELGLSAPKHEPEPHEVFIF